MNGPYPWEDFTVSIRERRYGVICPHCGTWTPLGPPYQIAGQNRPAVTEFIDAAGDHLHGRGGREKCRGK